MYCRYGALDTVTTKVGITASAMFANVRRMIKMSRREGFVIVERKCLACRSFLTAQHHCAHNRWCSVVGSELLCCSCDSIGLVAVARPVERFERHMEQSNKLLAMVQDIAIASEDGEQGQLVSDLREYVCLK